MTSFRFCVLSAVSTEDQAKEGKDSLDFQLKTSRSYGERMGGTFTREYRAAGFSRSGWYDFTTQVLQQCEGFADLALDARAHCFDVILMENYDRVGDIGVMLFNYLASVGSPYIQMRSVQQPLVIEEPELYNPRKDETTTNAIADALKHNKARTNKISRAFEVGNARRARDGKPNNACPYGYIKISKNQVVVNDNVAPLIRNFAKWYLEGVIMSEVVRRANASGITAQRGGAWSDKVITQMFDNPFYAGRTFYGRWKLDSKGHSRPTKDPVELYEGQHEPLWSYQTYLALRKEMARRYKVQHLRRDYNFTAIIKCSVCKRSLRIQYGTTTPDLKKWVCPNGHVGFRQHEAERMVADELTRLFSDKEYTPTHAEQAADYIKRELGKVKQRLLRLDEENEAGAYGKLEFVEKRKKLLARIAELEDEDRRKDEVDLEAAHRVAVIKNMRALLPHFHTWISDDPPGIVKYHLSRSVRLIAHPASRTITAELI